MILQTFSSHHAACFSTAHVTRLILSSLHSHSTMFLCSLLMLYTFPHAAKSPRTADATLLVLNTFFIGTTGVTFLIMKTFSSHHTPCCPTADATLLVLHTFSTRTVDVTFLILQTFCSHHTPSPPITDAALLILSLSPHTAQLCDRLLQKRPSVYCTFSFHITDVTFQILQSFSSHQTHCDSMGDVALPILHNLQIILQMHPSQ